MATKKKVVVVGGGYGGAAVAKNLDAKFEVTLVEKRTHFYHTIGGIRGAVDETFIDKLLIPYSKLLKNGKVVHQEAVEISSTEVKLKDESTLSFDYLVIALGASYTPPAQVSAETGEAKNELKTQGQKIKDANKILIVGGGATGVEFSGEIRNKYPNKEITIVHSKSTLLQPGVYKPGFYSKLMDRLKFHNIKVILDDKLQKPEETVEGSHTFTTEKGVSIEADLVFWTTGNKVANGPLKQNFQDKLNEEGRLKVNEHLQVEGFQNIFAVGDITDVKETKTAFAAKMFQAPVVAKNITTLAAGKTKLGKYSPKGDLRSGAVMITLGPKDGVSQLPLIGVVGAGLTSSIKGKDLTYTQYWKFLDQPVPQ